jgi:hypothetical protein
MTAWKDLERTVAKKFGGYRIPRGGDFSESLPDVVADVTKLFPLANKVDAAFVVECKYRQHQPWINKYKTIKKEEFSNRDYCVLKFPVTNAGNMEDNICMMPIDYIFDFFSLSNSGNHRIVANVLPDYILDYCSQSYNYALDIEYRMRVHLYYWKLCKDQTKKKFNSFIPLVAIGQKNDKVRLAIFYESELLRVRQFSS